MPLFHELLRWAEREEALCVEPFLPLLAVMPKEPRMPSKLTLDTLEARA
jgi:hypothetical protein